MTSYRNYSHHYICHLIKCIRGSAVSTLDLQELIFKIYIDLDAQAYYEHIVRRLHFLHHLSLGRRIILRLVLVLSLHILWQLYKAIWAQHPLLRGLRGARDWSNNITDYWQ